MTAASLPAGLIWPLAILLGGAWGSFVATLVLRWPQGQPVSGRSRCDGCGQALRPWELIPVLSWLIQRGRCRRCRAPINRFHLTVELAAMAIAVAALLVLPGDSGWLWMLFGWLLLPLALLDARHFWLPDRLNLLLAVTGLLLAGPMLDMALMDRWLGAVTGGGVMALLAYVYRRARGTDGMGGGDPKLVAALGCWLGWQPLPLMLLMAGAMGIVWALAMQGTEKEDRSLMRRPIPFGVFACSAGWLAVPLWLIVR